MACLKSEEGDDAIPSSGTKTLEFNASTSAPAQLLMSRKYFGLDPVNRICLKLFIRDVISLQEYVFQEVDSVGFCFHGHVVERVEIMGIIVRVDLKDIKHSYVVDDGTGIILCNLWRNDRYAYPHKMNDLPSSLLKKYDEITSSSALQNEGFHHGDLVCIRGRVLLYCGQKEIDILNISKSDNPNREFERVLELPDIYAKCYSKPFNLPDRISKIVSHSDSELLMSIDTLKFSISKHIEQNLLTLDVFSVEDLLSWPSIKSLKYSKSIPNITCKPLKDLIESALKSISETQGLICKRSDSTDEYEVIKEACGLSKEVLKIFRMLYHETKSTTAGYHINQIHSLLNRSPRYAGAMPIVLQKTFQCLENSSDVISIDSYRYIPLS